MSSRRVIVSARAIAALLPFVSKAATRYYLNGIHIEPANPEFDGVLLVATDGTRMGIVHDLLGETDGAHNLSIPPLLKRMLGRGAANAARAARAHFVDDAAHLVTTDFPDTGNVSIPSEHHLFTGYAPDIEGQFPNWRRILNFADKREHDGAAIAINPTFLADFVYAAATLRTSRFAPPSIRMYAPKADEAALITAEHAVDGLSFVGLLMPQRDNFSGDGKIQPAWLAPAEDSSETKAA